MDSLSIFIQISIVVVAIFIISQLIRNSASTKPKGVKKEEIIQTYKEQIKALNKKYKDDKELLRSKKMELLKSINSELQRNIFFEQSETKQIINSLANL